MPVANEFIRETESYRSPYEEWKTSEGLPTIRGYYIRDLKTVALTPWESRGGSGVFIDLEGCEGFNNSYLCEIPPRESLNPIKHIYNEMVYVLEGHGTTSVWIDERKKQTFEWQERSLFAIPPNAWYQHHNVSGSEPARYYAVTAAPRVINTFNDLDFVFNNSHVMRSRFNDEDGYFQQAPKDPSRLRWNTNFIADILANRDPEREQRENLAQRGSRFALVNGSVKGHVRGWPVGTYTNAHRHGPGIHVVQVGEGDGFSLMWKEGRPVERIDWTKGSVFVPPEGWFHHHFNTSGHPAFHLAMGWGSDQPRPGDQGHYVYKSIAEGGDEIPFDLENPETHRIFEEALAANGVRCGMGKLHPSCTYR